MTIEGDIISIPEWTYRWLDPNERYICQGASEKIIEKALLLLGKEKIYEIIDGEDIISIVQPHGSMGYERSKVIIDVFRGRQKKAAYLFLDDGTGQIMVINRPNSWIATKKDGRIEVFKVGKNGTDIENYEVGEIELTSLLEKLK